MFEMFDDSKVKVSKEEMEEVMAIGTKVVVQDSDVEVTSYLHNNKVYIYDVKHKGDTNVQKTENLV